MRVAPLRKGATADTGPWMNRVTASAKAYLMELGTLCVQMEDDVELELIVQDCNDKGDVIKSAEQIARDEIAKADRETSKVFR